MCSIMGIYRFDGCPVDVTVIDRMRHATVHRGPDDHGTWADGNVGLAHNRLSILDLSPNAHQPMYDPDGDNWIVYNGEVYNFQEVRCDLEEAGYRFRSSGDTEVILYAYREWGADCLHRFNGMFALAIFNEKTRELFLARDRLGIKPLYYYADDKQFIFSSEIKTILLADGVERRINRDALPELTAFRYLAGGRTLIEHLYELNPGHHMLITPDGVGNPRQYWDIPFDGDTEGNETDWLEGLQEVLKKSVAYRLISDVPVGCALSGGIDSSLVTALACEASTSAMKTFSIGFDVDGYDERSYARHVADVLGIENFSEVLGQSEFYNRIPQLVWHLDEPLNHPNSVGIWLLARLARPKVTVLLTGEGGDELLGGYSQFRTVLKLRHLAQMLPCSRMLARLLPKRTPGRLGLVARELRRDDAGMMIWSSASLPSPFIEQLFGEHAVEQAEAIRRSIIEARHIDHPVNRHLYYELKTYLVSVLMRVDRMTMAHGLEARVPILDHTVVEYASRMPISLKMDRYQGKKALLELASRRFGAGMFHRPKMGFPIPRPYFHGTGFELLKDLIHSRSFRQRDLMAPSAVDALVRAHEAGGAGLDSLMWLLGTLELWAQTFIDKPGVVAA